MRNKRNQVYGFGRYQEKLKRIRMELPEELDRFLIELAEELIDDVKNLTPVDTGHLRRSWAVSDIIKEGANVRIEVFNTAEYALMWGM